MLMPLAETIKELVSFILEGVGYLSAGDTLVGKTLKRLRLERIMKVYVL